MKVISLILISAFSTSLAFAGTTFTQCVFKKNPNNKLSMELKVNGKQLDTAKAAFQIETGSGVKSLTYYNYAFMLEAMNYRENIPYGRRAEFLNFSEDLERSGILRFRVVNFQATNNSVEFASIPRTKKILPVLRAQKRIGFDAVVKTILKTENARELENGTTLSVNEVSCVQSTY